MTPIATCQGTKTRKQIYDKENLGILNGHPLQKTLDQTNEIWPDIMLGLGIGCIFHGQNPGRQRGCLDKYSLILEYYA